MKLKKTIAAAVAATLCAVAIPASGGPANVTFYAYDITQGTPSGNSNIVAPWVLGRSYFNSITLTPGNLWHYPSVTDFSQETTVVVPANVVVGDMCWLQLSGGSYWEKIHATVNGKSWIGYQDDMHNNISRSDLFAYVPHC